MNLGGWAVAEKQFHYSIHPKECQDDYRSDTAIGMAAPHRAPAAPDGVLGLRDARPATEIQNPEPRNSSKKS